MSFDYLDDLFGKFRKKKTKFSEVEKRAASLLSEYASGAIQKDDFGDQMEQVDIDFLKLTTDEDGSIVFSQDTPLWLNLFLGNKFRRWNQIRKVINNSRNDPNVTSKNGSAMRCSPAGWLAKSEEECIRMAIKTAVPTHNHPEGIKGAVATALSVFYLKNGCDKGFVKDVVLGKYYPQWAGLKYGDFHDEYAFDSTCPGSVGPAIICFLESRDYVDCLRLAISLGGDADTLAAIAGPMAYAYYKTMPDSLVYKALKTLPEWMASVNERFDELCNIEG